MSDPNTVKTKFRDPAKWAPVRASSAASQIVSQVRKALFDGHLTPGDALGSEMELSERFGVSRITVRDALRTLEATGIVEIRVGAGGGARIASGNPEYFADALAIQLKLIGISQREIVDSQLAIEPHAADLAATHATPEDLADLESLVTEAESLAGANDLDGFNEAGLAFHIAVAEASQNRALAAQLKALRLLVQQTFNERTTPEVARRVCRFYRALFDQIAAGDSAAARKTVTDHLSDIRDRVFPETEPFGDVNWLAVISGRAKPN